jgi:phosphatidylethanolamine/phosphatidyl-N-methylethanolamine N-methyltransferase
MTQVNHGETKESELFFRQWLRSPKSMGSVLPSSRALARAVTRAIVWRPGQQLIELGAGTGAITRGLVESRLPLDAITVVELDDSLCAYLRARFPGIRVIHGDATRLGESLGPDAAGRVGTVISGLPMVNMPLEFQRAIIEQSFALLGPGGCILQYSYSPIRPVPARKLGIKAELLNYVVRNMPPATVWRFTRPNGHHAAPGNGHRR